MAAARRFEVYRVSLDPTRGSEIKKSRRYVVLSPDQVNRRLKTVIVAPLTSTQHPGWPFRITCRFASRPGEIALDQLRCVDETRLTKLLGTIDATSGQSALTTLQTFFAP